MKLRRVLSKLAIVAAVAMVACDDEAVTKESENIPTKPIEEMCYTPAKSLFEV